MDRAMLQKHLAQAERHVAEGEAHLARQRALIRKLERDGHGSRAARLFLRSLEETQALHLADRDRVRAELRGARGTRQSLSIPRATL
jgi:regulator of protease activity HflC (stomatin/prohibitin superfamily)